MRKAPLTALTIGVPSIRTRKNVEPSLRALPTSDTSAITPTTTIAGVTTAATTSMPTISSHGHAHGFGAIAKSSLVHTLQVTLFIFLVSLALEIVIDGVGEDALASFISANSNLSVVVSAIVGLIPNCAASVVLTELYLEGALSTGAMLAGLLVSAGVGLLVLFRANRPMHENFLIVAGLVACGVVFGFIVGVFGIAL